MQEVKLKISNPTGLHTRPGSEFVQLAKQFESDIIIKKGDKKANAKSMIKLLKIGISCGDEIELSVSGVDEKAALAALISYIENLTE